MSDVRFKSSMGVQYIDHMGDDKRIAQAARVSTNTDTSTRPHERLVRRLWEDGHTSPFEHNTLTVKASVPIFVAREWMRHRTFAFNELSGRYSEMEPVFYVPGEDRPLVQTGKAMDYRREMGDLVQRDAVWEAVTDINDEAWYRYKYLIESGIANEVARNVLPVSLYTRFYATANLRNWLHFIALRTDPTALWEIQDAACQVADLIQEKWPTAWNAYNATRSST